MRCVTQCVHAVPTSKVSVEAVRNEAWQQSSEKVAGEEIPVHSARGYQRGGVSYTGENLNPAVSSLYTAECFDHADCIWVRAVAAVCVWCRQKTSDPV